MFEKEIVRMIKKETKLKEVQLQVPTHVDYGDYAFPCFQLAKAQKRNPMELALELSEKIKPNELVERVVPKGPYVNFFLNRKRFNELTLKAILRMQDRYGTSYVGKGQSVLLEHTSVNPNAAPHVGRARNALLGDAIARLLRFQEYKTEVHYYINDVGKQIAMLVYGAKGKAPTFKGLLNLYVKTNEKVKSSKKAEQEVFNLLSEFEAGNKDVQKRFKKIVDTCIKGQKDTLSQLGIKYDVFDYESKYLFNKATVEIVKKYEKTKKVFTDEEGRKVLDLSGFDLAMKSPVLVLTRNDGTSLYGLRDIAYNVEKAKAGKARNILVLGEDQKLYAKQMDAALALLKIKGPEVVHYSFITLSDGGKMSTRAGTVVLLEDFMNEAVKKAKAELKKRNAPLNEKLAKIIGLGAVKFAILKVSAEKNIAFDWNSALSFEGESSPYIQYAYARTQSIVRKAKKVDTAHPDFSLAVNPEEIALINKLYQFPEVAQKATQELKPHIIATYAYQTAQLFNDFYRTSPVISENEPLTKARLVVVKATAQVLKNALQLLGIDAPQRM